MVELEPDGQRPAGSWPSLVGALRAIRRHLRALRVLGVEKLWPSCGGKVLIG